MVRERERERKKADLGSQGLGTRQCAEPRRRTRPAPVRSGRGPDKTWCTSVQHGSDDAPVCRRPTSSVRTSVQHVSGNAPVCRFPMTFVRTSVQHVSGSAPVCRYPMTDVRTTGRSRNVILGAHRKTRNPTGPRMTPSDRSRCAESKNGNESPPNPLERLQKGNFCACGGLGQDHAYPAKDIRTIHFNSLTKWTPPSPRIIF